MLSKTGKPPKLSDISSKVKSAMLLFHSTLIIKTNQANKDNKINLNVYINLDIILTIVLRNELTTDAHRCTRIKS